MIHFQGMFVLVPEWGESPMGKNNIWSSCYKWHLYVARVKVKLSSITSACKLFSICSCAHCVFLLPPDNKINPQPPTLWLRRHTVKLHGIVSLCILFTFKVWNSGDWYSVLIKLSSLLQMCGFLPVDLASAGPPDAFDKLQEEICSVGNTFLSHFSIA